MSNKITCNNYIYQDGDIRSGSCYLGNSLAAEELSIDTLDADIAMGETTFQPSGSDGFESSDGVDMTCSNPVSAYAYGNEVNFEHDDALVGKFYFEKLKRKSMLLYSLSSVSAMGLLDNMIHYGGIYSGVPAGTIIANIMGDIPYTISDSVAQVSLNGYLPVDTCRNNLQQVLFAIGAGVFKDSDGNILIKFIESDTPAEIPQSRIYVDGSVDYKTPCTEVDITEHSYYALSSDRTVTLLETSEVLSSRIIAFDNPCHDLTVSGSMSIESSGVNYAVVSGSGTLTGKEYTHTKKIVPYTTGISSTENVVTVTDATLVTISNSYNVAKRVAQYYSAVSEISTGIVVQGERPADIVSFTNMFGEAAVGYIKSMDITLSNVLKANADIAIGFVPSGQGNTYNHYEILTEDEGWAVPSGIDRIRVVLIAGGSGGTDGENGGTSVIATPSSGYVPWTYSGISATQGGKGGSGGQAGKVRDVIINVSEGQSFSASIGAGGAVGSSGGVTSFGDYSSEDGSVSASGYADLMTSTIYAIPGDDGTDGGDGGSSGQSGGSAGSYSGGYGAASGSGLLSGTTGAGDYVFCSYSKGGSGGGGAAIDASGGSASGSNPYAVKGYVYPNPSSGRGASAADREIPASYGSGGHGGHGGGGNGQYNSVSFTNPSTPAPYALAPNIWANGGSGGKASAGRQGCVIIYY